MLSGISRRANKKQRPCAVPFCKTALTRHDMHKEMSRGNVQQSEISNRQSAMPLNLYALLIHPKHFLHHIHDFSQRRIRPHRVQQVWHSIFSSLASDAESIESLADGGG